MTTNDEWEEQLRVIAAWRDGGHTVAEFLSACAAQYERRDDRNYWDDFKQPDGSPWPCPAGFETQWEDHRQKRQAIRDGLDQGLFPFQIISALGMDVPADPGEHPEVLHDQISHREKHITQLEQIIAKHEREIVELRDERDALKAQAASAKTRRRRGSSS